jgi:hypothetical protein
MNYCSRKSSSGRRGLMMVLVIVLMAMTGMTGLLLSSHFSTVYRHVRLQADKAQARQLADSACQWVRQHRADVLAAANDELTLPVPADLPAQIRITRTPDKSAVTVEAVVHRGRYKTVVQRITPLASS